MPLSNASSPSACLDLNVSLKAGLLPCDDPDDLVDKTTRNTVSIVLTTVLTPPVCLLGIVTNIINCLVFFKQGLKDRVNFCLFSLSLTDLLYMLTSTVDTAYTIRRVLALNGEWIEDMVGGHGVVHLGVSGLAAGFSRVSHLISLIIVVERCICITAPLRMQLRVLKTKAVAIVVISASIVVMAGCQFSPARYEHRCVWFLPDDIKFLTAVPSKFFLENQALVDAMETAFSVGIPMGSFVAVITTTVVVIIKLRSTKQWREDNSAGESSTNRKEAAVTRMLVIVSCVYVVCVSPHFCHTVAKIAVPDFSPSGRYCNLFLVIMDVKTLFLSINSSVNLFVYRSRGSRFQNTLKELMRTCKYKKSATLENEMKRSGTVLTDQMQQPENQNVFSVTAKV